MLKAAVLWLVLASLAASGAGLLAPDQAFALSCVDQPFIKAYERHDLLLHGKLVDKGAPPPASNVTTVSASKVTTLVFETVKVYKGEHRDEFTVKADLYWDDHYREGEEYVLFADARRDHYYRELCVGDYVATEGIVRFLDDYVEGRSTGRGVFSLYAATASVAGTAPPPLQQLWDGVPTGDLFTIVMLASPVAVGILVHVLLRDRRWKKTFAGLSVLLGYIIVFFTYIPIFVLVFGSIMILFR